MARATLIGIDVGGTFTDLVAVDPAGTTTLAKSPSTPADPSIATVDGIKVLCEKAGIKPGELDQVFHGTTVATNIVIEHNGANVGMITTRGYRDIIHIARHKKPMNFSLWQNLPWQAYPIARRRNRLTVNERILADGSIQIPLDEREVRAQVRKLKKANVDSVAVCLLFSFMRPAHEQAVRDRLGDVARRLHRSLRQGRSVDGHADGVGGFGGGDDALAPRELDGRLWRSG